MINGSNHLIITPNGHDKLKLTSSKGAYPWQPCSDHLLSFTKEGIAANSSFNLSAAYQWKLLQMKAIYQ